MQQYVSRRFIIAFLVIVALLTGIFAILNVAREKHRGPDDSAANPPVAEGSVDNAFVVKNNLNES